MKALECEICKATRAERCRVRQSDQNDTRHAQPPFSEAPYVVPYNLPKYFAQQLRALQFAQNAQPPQQLLWIVARDMLFLGSIKQLRGAELAKREAQWLQKHDQATNGIMGFFPVAKDMPVRFTATVNKEYKIYTRSKVEKLVTDFIEEHKIYAQYGKDSEGLFNVQFLVEEENDF